MKQHDRHACGGSLDRREEQSPAKHHQHAGGQHPGAGGSGQAQGACLLTQQHPERQAKQAEGAAKPGRGQRIGIGLVYENADGAEQRASEKKGKCARRAAAGVLGVVRLRQARRSIVEVRVRMHDRSLCCDRMDEKRIIRRSIIR